MPSVNELKTDAFKLLLSTSNRIVKIDPVLENGEQIGYTLSTWENSNPENVYKLHNRDNTVRVFAKLDTAYRFVSSVKGAVSIYINL